MTAANTWRPIKVGNTDALGSGTNTGTLSFIAGTGITLAWDATNKRIIITNSSPDVNHNTDETVRQVPKTDNVNRPLMMINGSTSAGEQVTTSMFSAGIYANASTKMITANGFIKADSSNSYVLLGGGGHKAESSLSVANADKVDGYHASSLVKFYLSPMTSGAPADSAKSWFINTMPSASGAIVYNVPGSEKTIIAGKSSGAHGHMLQLNYDDNYLRILRYRGGSWVTTDWEKISAGYADSAGNADTVDGLHVHGGRNNEANKIVRTDGSGYI